MKNRVIKKIMAYLLVGAMVITTPMTASASESVLQKAYSVDGADGKNSNSDTDTGTDTDTDTDTDTNTDTNTNTNSGGIPWVPIEPGYPVIHALLVNPTDLQFETTGEVQALEATVVLDESEMPKPDPKPEDPEEPDDNEMSWATEDEKDALRKKIEESIRWYVEVPENAEKPVKLSTTSGKSVGVESIFPGEATVYAWIEADGKSLNEKNDRPTAGDYVAEATVSVKKTLKGIKFNPTLRNGDGSDVENFKTFDKFTWGKRQYDLRKFTILEYTDGTHQRASDSDIKLTYSISSVSDSRKIKATITGSTLKITKGLVDGTINIDVISEDYKDYSLKDNEIKLVNQNVVNSMNKLNTADKTKTLDFNEGDEPSIELSYPGIINKDKSTTIASSTDELVWSTNKPKIIKVEPIEETLSHGDCTKAKITALDVGTAKVTVKSTSGKSAVYTVNVYATPESVEIQGDTSGYTGKPIALKAVLKGKDGNELPVGSTKLTWSINKIKDDKNKDKKDPNAKISGKKENATVTPANLLVDLTIKDKKNNHKDTATISVNVVASYKYGTKSTVKKEVDKPFEITLKQSDVEQVQIDMYRPTTQKDGHPGFDTNETLHMSAFNNKGEETYAVTYNKKQFDVGLQYIFDATSVHPESANQMDTIAWAVTGKGIDSYSVEVPDGNNISSLWARFNKNVKATFKASYITLQDQGADKNPKAVKNTKTINITPVKKAESIAFAKPVVVKNPAKNPKKPQTVTFTIAEAPKKSEYGKVEWKVLAYNNSNPEKEYKASASGGSKVDTDSLIKAFKDKSVTINVPGDFTTGSVIKVGAYSEFGVVAYGYIYITEQTKTVIPYAKVGSGEGEATLVKNMDKKQVTMKLFDEGKINSAQLSVKFDTQVNEVGTNGKVTAQKYQGREDGLLGKDLGDTKSYITDTVTYSLDKKSALIIKVDDTGKITPLNRGTATVTIKALNGKSAKVKVVVQ